ncbi:MAG: EamA family transporter [Pseudomonadota bacterium]|nr:EamA family transporter [Pseudomonadota bacterium]
MDSGLASIFNAATPVFTVLLAHYLTTDEKMTWSKGGGVAVGFGGVAFLIGPEALSRFYGPMHSRLAIVAAKMS